MSEEPNVEQIIAEATAPAESPESPVEGGAAEAGALADTEGAEESSSAPEGTRVLKYKGKEISLDDERYRNYAQKGYDYDTKMHDFRVERKMFEQERQKLQEQYDELKQINEYAKENPRFEQIIKEQWALAQSGQSPAMEPKDEVSLLRAQLNQLQSQMSSRNEQAEARRVAEMEAAQEGSIAKFKDEHSYLDWSSKDEHGLTLEDKIGQKMMDEKVKDFGVMAKAMLLDKIIAHKTLQGKESAAKEIQKANKLGLGKVTDKSVLGTKKVQDVGKKSYDDLVAEGLSELGIEF